MNVLILQSRTRPEIIAAEQGEYRRAIGKATPIFVSTLDESLRWDDPASIIADAQADAVIIGGSGEFDLDGGRALDDPARTTARVILDRLKPFITYLVEHDVPTMGVCFGHQLIGETFGGDVQSDPSQKKAGSFETQLTEAGERDPLLSTLPKTFMAQYGHKDSLTKLPTGATLLAATSNCKFSALRYGSHVYTTQFHPELTAKDVIFKFNNSPGYLPAGVIPESLVKESPESSELIGTFVTQLA